MLVKWFIYCTAKTHLDFLTESIEHAIRHRYHQKLVNYPLTSWKWEDLGIWGSLAKYNVFRWRSSFFLWKPHIVPRTLAVRAKENSHLFQAWKIKACSCFVALCKIKEMTQNEICTELKLLNGNPENPAYL